MVTNEYADRPADQGTAGAMPEKPLAARQFLLKDPEEAPRRARFRRRMLILAATITFVSAASYGARVVFDRWSLARSYEGWMRNDLTRLSTFQNDYRAAHATFATLDQLGTSFVPSQGVTIEIHETNATSWSATATHVRTRTVCSVTARLSAPATDNTVTCNRS